MLQVLDSHLGLAIRSQPPALTALADISQRLTQTSGHGVRQGHAICSFITGIAKHDALVASTHIHFVLAHMHTTCNVWALLVDANQHLAGLVTKALTVHAGQVVHKAVEADLCNHTPHHLVVVELSLRCDFTCTHHHVVLGGSLAGYLGLGVCSQASVKHRIGDLVTDLVGMSFVDRLRREKEGAAKACLLLRWFGHGCQGSHSLSTIDFSG